MGEGDFFLFLSFNKKIMTENKKYYETLEIEENATLEEIKKSYRRLAQTWHPDKNNSPEATKKFQEISVAYSALTNEEPGEYDLYNLEDALNELIDTKKNLNLAAKVGKSLLEQNTDLQQKLQLSAEAGQDLLTRKIALEQKINEEKERVEKLENNIREYHKENEKLKDNQDQDAQTLTELTEKIEKLSKENKRLSGENKKLTAENQALSGENQETHSTNEEEEKLEQKLEVAKKEARESQQAFEQLQKQELEAWELILKERAAEKKKLLEIEKTNHQIATENEQLKIQLEAVFKESNEANQRSDDWEKEILDIEGKKNELEWEIESLQDELRETKTEVKRLENEWRKREKKPTSSWKKEVEKTEKEILIKELRRENSEIKKALQTSNELLEKFRIDYEELEEILKEKNEEVKKILATKDKKIKKLKNHCQEIEQQYQETKEQLINLLEETSDKKNNKKNTEVKKPVKQTPGWKNRLFQTAKYVAINGLSFYGGNRHGYQNSSNATSVVNNQPVITCSNPQSLPFTPALNLAAVDTSPISPLQSFYDQVIVNKKPVSYNLELHGRSLDHLYEEIISKKREIKSLKKENVRKDILITNIKRQLTAEQIGQQRIKSDLNSQISDLNARLKTEREIYSKNVSNYENEIRKLEEQNITQENSFADLEIKTKQNKESFRRQIQFREGKISNLINQKRELTNQLNKLNTDLLSVKENSRFEITRLKSESKNYQKQRDLRPDITFTDYQQLLTDKNKAALTIQELEKKLEYYSDWLTKWTNAFNNQTASEVKENQTKLQNKLNVALINYDQVLQERDNRPNITIKEYQKLVVENSLLNSRPNITQKEFTNYSSPRQVNQKIKSTQEKEAGKYRHHKSPLEIAQLKQEAQEQKEYELIRSGWKNPEEVTRIKNDATAREKELEAKIIAQNREDITDEPNTIHKIFAWISETYQTDPLKSSVSSGLLILLGKNFYQKWRNNAQRVKELESDKTGLEQSKEKVVQGLDQEKARAKNLEKQVGELAILYGKEKVKNKKLIAGQKIFKERAKDLKRELDTHQCKKIFVNCQEACCLGEYQRLQKIISSLESQLEEKGQTLLQQINSFCQLGLKVEELKVNKLISRIQELIRIPNTANQKMAQELAALQKVVDEKDATFRKELAQVIKLEIQGLKTLFSGAVDNHVTQQISTATNYPQIIHSRQEFLANNLKNYNQSPGLSQVEKTQIIFLIILLVANLVGIGLLINKKKKRIKS